MTVVEVDGGYNDVGTRRTEEGVRDTEEGVSTIGEGVTGLEGVMASTTFCS